MRIAQQLTLPLASDPTGLRLPCAVSPRKIRRAAKRGLRALAAPRFGVRALLEGHAMLEQVRHHLRTAAARGTGRVSKAATAVYVASPEGRQLARAIERLHESLATQEARLCG